jgi:tetratricopeptide (TPR) repeat protein
MTDTERFETILKIVIASLVIGVIGFAGFFGWTVYRDRIDSENATPAARIVNVLKMQVRKYPNSDILRVRLGEALVAQGKSQAAIEQFNAALKINPKHAGALLDLGQVAFLNNRSGEARRYYEQVVKLTNGDEMQGTDQGREIAFYQLGVLSLSEKQYEDAIGYFKEALRIRKDASDTYFYLARAFDGIGETDEAKKQLLNALAFDPNFAQANYFLAELYMRDNDKALASYYYGKAARANPNAKEPREAIKRFGPLSQMISKARTAFAAKDYKAALTAIQIARNLYPENVAAARLHAEIALAAGDKKQALKVYKELGALVPKDKAVQTAIEKLSEETSKTAAKSKSKSK